MLKPTAATSSAVPPSAPTGAARRTEMPRETRDTLFLLGVIAWVVLPHAARLPLWCVLMSAAVLLWRGALAW